MNSEPGAMKMRADETDEIYWLDVLVLVAENIKLLTIGPILAGLLAWGVGSTLSPSYVSQAILIMPVPVPASALATTSTLPPTSIPTPIQVAAMLTSPVILDPVIESLKLGGGQPIELVRKRVGGQIKAIVGNEGLLRLNVVATTPAQAQALANAVIESWLKSTVPGEQDRADLEKRFAYAKVSLDATNRLLERLAAEGGASLNRPLTRGDAGTSIVAVGELQARYLNDVINIPRWLKGLSYDVVKQPPTLPVEPVSNQKRLIAVSSAIATGLVLLLWIFISRAWRDTAQDPQVAEKLARLRAALSLK